MVSSVRGKESSNDDSRGGRRTPRKGNVRAKLSGNDSAAPSREENAAAATTSAAAAAEVGMTAAQASAQPPKTPAGLRVKPAIARTRKVQQKSQLKQRRRLRSDTRNDTMQALLHPSLQVIWSQRATFAMPSLAALACAASPAHSIFSPDELLTRALHDDRLKTRYKALLKLGTLNFERALSLLHGARAETQIREALEKEASNENNTPFRPEKMYVQFADRAEAWGPAFNSAVVVACAHKPLFGACTDVLRSLSRQMAQFRKEQWMRTGGSCSSSASFAGGVWVLDREATDAECPSAPAVSKLLKWLCDMTIEDGKAAEASAGSASPSSSSSSSSLHDSSTTSSSLASSVYEHSEVTRKNVLSVFVNLSYGSEARRELLADAVVPLVTFFRQSCSCFLEEGKVPASAELSDMAISAGAIQNLASRSADRCASFLRAGAADVLRTWLERDADRLANRETALGVLCQRLPVSTTDPTAAIACALACIDGKNAATARTLGRTPHFLTRVSKMLTRQSHGDGLCIVLEAVEAMAYHRSLHNVLREVRNPLQEIVLGRFPLDLLRQALTETATAQGRAIMMRHVMITEHRRLGLADALANAGEGGPVMRQVAYAGFQRAADAAPAAVDMPERSPVTRLHDVQLSMEASERIVSVVWNLPAPLRAQAA